MLPQNEDELLVLARVNSEIEAASLVTALSAYDVTATATGGFTSGFKTEAPGDVQIVVQRGDFERAKRALAEIRDMQESIDWSQVDVGHPEDETP